MADDLTRAYDALLAAAQAVVNDGLEAAEEGIHPCDVHNEAAKAERMPAPLQALRYAAQAVRRAAPPSPVADDGLPELPEMEVVGQNEWGFVYGYMPDQMRQAQREAYEAGRAAARPAVVEKDAAQLRSARDAVNRVIADLSILHEGRDPISAAIIATVSLLVSGDLDAAKNAIDAAIKAGKDNA